MEVRYSPEAVADLVCLRAFIAEHDPAAAARVAEGLIARVEHLQRFPKLGREVERAPEPGTLRDMIFGNYVVRYTLHSETVMILRVWHHYENRPSGDAND